MDETEWQNLNLSCNISNTSSIQFATPSCVLGLLPCSITITGNLVLIIFYGLLLGLAAKIISDGAEMLLDLGLPASLIGGIVLPLLGAVPDSAMIIASGIGGSREEANKQIAVGMGTLAGSTIMLLTLPWLGSIILGRVEIVRGEAKDGLREKMTIKSFYKQGITVFPDVTYSVIIMLISAIPYLVVQGADWHWGPTHKIANKLHDGKLVRGTQPAYIKNSALATFLLAFVLFIAYLVFQIFYSVSSKRKEESRRQEMLKRRVLKQMYMATLGKFQPGGASKPATGSSVQGAEEETRPLLSSGKQKQFLGVWRHHRRAKEVTDGGEAEEGREGTNPEKTQENGEDPNWKIAIKSCVYLFVGVVMVTIFSDPMVNALLALADSENKKYYHYGGVFTRGQYIPIGVFYLSFVVTPLCSNASELVSSLTFAAKKTKTSSSLTFSQLYGAATMNNTLGLGIFAALVYFRDLDWQYSAEVTVILLVELVVGISALIAGFGYRHTYILAMGPFIGSLFFIAILMVWLLEKFADWK